MTDEHMVYFRRHREEELRRAQACVDPVIARIHHRFADLYGSVLDGKTPPAWSTAASAAS